MDMGSARCDSLIGSLSPIRVRCMYGDRFSIGSMIVMIIGGVWLWDAIGLIFSIKGVTA